MPFVGAETINRAKRRRSEVQAAWAENNWNGRIPAELYDVAVNMDVAHEQILFYATQQIEWMQNFRELHDLKTTLDECHEIASHHVEIRDYIQLRRSGMPHKVVIEAAMRNFDLARLNSFASGVTWRFAMDLMAAYTQKQFDADRSA